jgi:chemotaxis protein CheD
VNLVVDISDYKISGSSEDVIVTYSLGSCVGVALYDAQARVGGMIHCMLPVSRIHPDKAAANPAMFVDTGVALLLQTLFQMGAERRRLVAKVAGGSRLLGDGNLFNIGERNYTVLRKILWKNEIAVAGEDVGGSIPRTLRLHMEDGKTLVRSEGMDREL